MSSWVYEYVSVLPLCSRDDLNLKRIQKLDSFFLCVDDQLPQAVLFSNSTDSDCLLIRRCKKNKEIRRVTKHF